MVAPLFDRLIQILLRLLKRVRDVLFWIGLSSWFAMLTLTLTFYQFGSLTPNIATGQTVPVQMHGTVYITPLLAGIREDLLIVGIVALAVAIAMDFWRKRRQTAR